MEFKSRFAIGEKVELRVDHSHPIPAFVRAVTFTTGKVRYALFLREPGTTLHNVDSYFIHPVSAAEAETIAFEPDNYS